MCRRDLPQLEDQNRLAEDRHTAAQNRKCGRRKSLLQRVQPFVIEAAQPSSKFHGLRIFRFGYDDCLRNNRRDHELFNHSDSIQSGGISRQIDEFDTCEQWQRQLHGCRWSDYSARDSPFVSHAMNIPNTSFQCYVVDALGWENC